MVKVKSPDWLSTLPNDFTATRELLNSMLTGDKKFETNPDTFIKSRKLINLKQTKYYLPLRYKKGRTYLRFIKRSFEHTDPDLTDFEFSWMIHTTELTKRITSFMFVNHRKLFLDINQKRFKFEYRKVREEKAFYSTFINNLNISTMFPFVGFDIESRLPNQVKLDRPDPRFLRKRWSQPVFVNFNFILKRSHNGLRLRKKRRI